MAENPEVRHDAGSETNSTLYEFLTRPGEQRVFVHDYEAINVPTIDRTLGGRAHLLAERALLMAQPGDLVCLPEPVEPAYLNYLDSVGLGPGREGVLTVVDGADGKRRETGLLKRLVRSESSLKTIAERVDKRRAIRLSGFQGAEELSTVQQKLVREAGRDVVVEGGPPHCADFFNRKEVVRRRALELGVPVAPGEVVSWSLSSPVSGAVALRGAVDRTLRSSEGVLVRAARSASGADNLVVTSRSGADLLNAWLSERPHLTTFLVEALVEFRASPNVGAWIGDDGSFAVFPTTAQRLDERLSHLGNVYPHRSSAAGAIHGSVRKLVGWMSELGYRGLLGIDFIEPKGAGQPTHCLAEVNARVNGAAYGMAAFERLNHQLQSRGRPPIKAWLSYKGIRSGRLTFAKLADRIGDFLLAPGSSCGVLPYSAGWLRHGFVCLLTFADSADHAAEIEAELQVRLHAIA